MVVLIENDGRGCLLQLSRNGICGSTYLAEPNLLQSPGALVLQAADNNQAPIHVRELSFHRLPFVLVFLSSQLEEDLSWSCLFAFATCWSRSKTAPTASSPEAWLVAISKSSCVVRGFWHPSLWTRVL